MWFLFYSNRSGRGDVLKDRDKRGKMLGARSYMKRFEESDETPSLTFQSQALGICFHATVLTRSQEEINEKGYSPARRGAARCGVLAPYVFWYNKIKSGPPLPSCTYRTCPLSPSLPPPPSTYPRSEAGQVPLRPPPPPRLQDRADGKRVLRSCQTEVGAPKIYLRE